MLFAPLRLEPVRLSAFVKYFFSVPVGNTAIKLPGYNTGSPSLSESKSSDKLLNAHSNTYPWINEGTSDPLIGSYLMLIGWNHGRTHSAIFLEENLVKLQICGFEGQSKTPPPFLDSIPPYLRRSPGVLPSSSRRCRQRGKRSVVGVRLRAYLLLAIYYCYRWLKLVIPEAGYPLPCCWPRKIFSRACTESSSSGQSCLSAVWFLINKTFFFLHFPLPGFSPVAVFSCLPILHCLVNAVFSPPKQLENLQLLLWAHNVSVV